MPGNVIIISHSLNHNDPNRVVDAVIIPIFDEKTETYNS